MEPSSSSAGSVESVEVFVALIIPAVLDRARKDTTLLRLLLDVPGSCQKDVDAVVFDDDDDDVDDASVQWCGGCCGRRTSKDGWNTDILRVVI